MYNIFYFFIKFLLKEAEMTFYIMACYKYTQVWINYINNLNNLSLSNSFD